MKYNYCTVFDKGFLSRGLALHYSLLKHSKKPFRHFILCADDATYEILAQMNLKYIVLVKMEDFEASDPKILEAKNNRDHREYMWTLSSVFTYYVLTHYKDVEYATYLDADLYFYASPEIVFEDMGKNSILIIPHNLPSKEEEARLGTYNVGMVIFKNDENGRACLKWWRNECLTWCYAVCMSDKFGDQKYLDYFEEKFKGVFVYRQKGANLAKWNIENYKGKICKKNGRFVIDDDQLIFFHFSQWRQYYPNSFFLPFGPLNSFAYVLLLKNTTIKLLYREYAEALYSTTDKIRKIIPDFIFGMIPRPSVTKQIRDIASAHIPFIKNNNNFMDDFKISKAITYIKIPYLALRKLKIRIQKKMFKHVKDVFWRKGANNTFDVRKFPMGYYKTFGDKNPDKTFYVIWLDNKGAGLFSNVSSVLCHIKIALDAGMIPVVDFQNFQTHYNEKNPIHGTTNAWEYYFKPVSNYTLNEVYKSKNVFFCSGMYPVWMGYNMTEIEGISEIYKKYIFLQPHIEELVRENLKKFNFHNKTLGVHFRGQDMKYAPGHPFPPTEKQMLDNTDELLKKYNLEKIFVVTIIQEYNDLFIEKYGGKVVYTDSFRMSTQKKNVFNTHPRDNHFYLLGLEILIDAFLLSKCDGILCGDSNITEFVKFINPDFQFVYQIDNGFNSQNSLVARHLFSIKKMLPSSFGGLSNKVKIIKHAP
jgi:hypothetical protein